MSKKGPADHMTYKKVIITMLRTLGTGLGHLREPRAGGAADGIQRRGLWDHEVRHQGDLDAR